MEKVTLKFEHQGISVRDLDASVAWYQKVFDAEIIWRKYMDFLDCNIVYLKIANEVYIEVFQYMGADRKETPEERLNSITDLRTGGNKHVCYSLNLPEFYKNKIVPYNIHIDHGPEREGDNWLMFIRDPDGVLYEFWDVGGYVRDPHAFDGVECR